MYSIRFLDAADRELSKLDKPVGRRLVKRLVWLAENLDEARLEPLTGKLRGLYKLRVGDYRILYETFHEEEAVVIHTIGHRRDVYRR